MDGDLERWSKINCVVTEPNQLPSPANLLETGCFMLACHLFNSTAPCVISIKQGNLSFQPPPLVPFAGTVLYIPSTENCSSHRSPGPTVIVELSTSYHRTSLIQQHRYSNHTDLPSRGHSIITAKMIGGLLFSFWRFFQIVTLIPTLGMLVSSPRTTYWPERHSHSNRPTLSTNSKSRGFSLPIMSCA